MRKGTINVLLIDDDAEYRKVVQYHLQRSEDTSFHLTWKRDGQTGIQELLSNLSIDVVLMDYVLPGVDGIEVMKMFQKRNICVPVIFLTTQRSFDIAVEALRLGVFDYLVKDDLSDARLSRTIVNVLDLIDLKQRTTRDEHERMLKQKRTEALKELIVTISHEINNPLAAIKISTDIVSRNQLDERERQLLEKLLEKINVIEKEVAGLKKFSGEGQTGTADAR